MVLIMGILVESITLCLGFCLTLVYCWSTIDCMVIHWKNTGNISNNITDIEMGLIEPMKYRYTHNRGTAIYNQNERLR